MNAEAELLHAYREWRRLAEAEGQAIEMRDWTLLADCQKAIEDFQKLVGALNTEARHEWERTGQDCDKKEAILRVFRHELVAITQRNQRLLQAAQAEAQNKLNDLNEAGRNLKLLQRSYAYGADSAWSFVS